MSFNVNILLLILSYQCYTTCASKFKPSIKQLNESTKEETTTKKLFERYTIDYLLSPNRTDLLDCNLWVPFQDYNMPIPMTANTSTPEIISPNMNGNLIIRRNEYIKLSCSGSFFISPIIDRNINEVTIKCKRKNYVLYHHKQYKFREFICNDTPRPNIKLTQLTCQNNSNNRVLEVGFQTKNMNIKFYRICFDTKYKNPLYVWYSLQSPYIKRRQISRLRPSFVKTKVYDPVKINSVYKDQRQTLVEILNSTHVADHYIRRYDREHFLSRGHLVARTEFNYAFQQSATFFYENTVPQWHIFNVGIWKDIEKLFKRNMAAGKSKHVIVTGTYLTCMLPDRFNIERPLFLSLPKSIAVPNYLWKLDYNIDSKEGVVFVGMNNPYKQVDQSMYICEVITCPGTMVQRSKIVLLFYCCTLDSFQKAYGEIDPIIFARI